ncbi:pseudohemocyanin-2-like [Eriocheir sinensis]|uniref:pseudohemocyanin-2-like n=1 Tax=Eriocheir sinensis TaxID=95602 RepID=UPI0021C6CFC7|nr:pseudohemocyanin-2-like [Eriocheir sinensis]
MKVLVVFALVALSAAAAWPGFMSDEPDGVPSHQKQHDVNYAFYKIFEPIRDSNLLEKAMTFNPVSDTSMYKDGGVAVQKLMYEFTHKRLLEKKHWAAATNKRHLEEAIMLFEVFMQCKDWNCVSSNGAYFRERVNEEEFLYAAYHAIKHSPLTQHVVLPAVYEVKPHYFAKAEVIEQAYEAHEMKLRNIVFQNNFTGNLHDMEQRVAYYREDLGIGTHHLMMHLENPFWWKDTYGYHIDRKGENFFYVYHQLLNRYDAERISNYMPLLEELHLDEPLHEGFAPQTTYKFGAPFPIRNDDIQLHDVDRVGRIHELVHMVDRIHDAIAHGYVESDQGEKINIENDNGIAILGDIIQSSYYSPNRKYYGNLTTMAYTMLDRQVDPKDKYDLPPGVVAHMELYPRDPAAWRLHKTIDNIFREHIDSLPPYTKEQLEFIGIDVTDVQIQGTLETYFEEYKWDLVNAFNDNNTQTEFFDIYASTPRLNHKEFSYKIKVQNNNGSPKKAVIRILAMPYRDGNGALIPFDEGRWLAIEMDLFVKTLTPGSNVIVRKSSEASITVPDPLTYKTLVEKTEARENLEMYESATGIPERLLLPKGNEEGVQFRLWVAVTDAAEDVNDESIITMKKYHHYGVHGVQPDKRPFGYPLDRRIPDEQTFYEVPNFKETMVKVYNHNVFIALPRH